MEIVGPDNLVPFVPAESTDAAYPARIGEPSVDGPIIYPEQQPDEPQDISDFQRETGLDPKKIPSLRELGPKLRLLEGGKPSNAGGPVPEGRIRNDTNPTTMVRFGATPETPAATDSIFTPKTLLVAAAVGLVGYFIGRASGNSAPLIADLSDEE